MGQVAGLVHAAMAGVARDGHDRARRCRSIRTIHCPSVCSGPRPPPQKRPADLDGGRFDRTHPWRRRPRARCSEPGDLWCKDLADGRRGLTRERLRRRCHSGIDIRVCGRTHRRNNHAPGRRMVLDPIPAAGLDRRHRLQAERVRGRRPTCAGHMERICPQRTRWRSWS